MGADGQVVTALNVLPGHGPEALGAVTLIEQEERARRNDVRAASLGGAGPHGEALRALTQPGGPQVEVYVPPKEVAAAGRLTAGRFTPGEKGQALTCPAGRRRTGGGGAGTTPAGSTASAGRPAPAARCGGGAWRGCRRARGGW